MIYELEPAQYARVRPLVGGLDIHLSIQAVLDGTVAGQVWADDVTAPQATFIITPEGQYLAGAPDNPAFNQALAELLLTSPWATLKYHPDGWEPFFAVLLACKFARKYPRRYYALRQFVLPDWREQVPPEYAMLFVDTAFLARRDLENMDEVRQRISEWTDFARDGFGFCLVHGATIVTRCIGDCRSGTACEIGINTHPDYRQRGLATLTVAATVEYCLAHGLPAIGWHCLANNHGSQRVAEKVGFVLAREYPNYANHGMAEQAGDLSAEEWRTHAAFFEHAFMILNEHRGLLGRRAAQTWAVAGDHERALALLHRLAEAEGRSPRWGVWLRESWEFAGLHADPRWQALLKQTE